MIGRVVFIRHGESVWNITDPARGLVTKFTGWADIDLTEHGIKQAQAAGRCLKMFGIYPDAVFTSLLKRSIDTYNEIAKPEHADIKNVLVINTWRLNERHYGSLVGLSKAEAEIDMGKEKVRDWRRSWDQAPPPMRGGEHFWRTAAWAEPKYIVHYPDHKTPRIMKEKDVIMPKTESLKDCAARVRPIWETSIAPKVARGETVLVVAHANSIRSMVKHIDNATISDDAVREVHIPSATPLVYNFALTDPSLLVADKKTFIENVAKSLKPVGVPSKLGMTGRYLASREVVNLALKSSVPAEEDIQDEPKDNLLYFDLVDKGLTETDTKEALIVSDGKGVVLHAKEDQLYKLLLKLDVNQLEIDLVNEKIKTGLPAQTKITHNGKNGKSYENHLTVIPIYDWLDDETSTLSIASDATLELSVRSLQISRASSFLDYGGSTYHGKSEKLSKFLKPSYYVVKLESVT
jgi:2,3-bisphosphoglycerate-dependent phosphoglycerate mutase